MSKVFNFFKKIWIFLLLGIIAYIFIVYNQLIAIIATGILLISYIVSYLISLSLKNRIIRSAKQYPLLSDKQIAKKLNLPIEEIRKNLFILSKNQKRKKWLIVFLNKRYIFYNEDTVERFKKLHQMGYNEKDILKNLQKQIQIRTRAEIKAIQTTLTSQKRL